MPFCEQYQNPKPNIRITSLSIFPKQFSGAKAASGTKQQNKNVFCLIRTLAVLKNRRDVIGRRRVIFQVPNGPLGHCAVVPSHGPASQIAKVVPHWIPWVVNSSSTIDDGRSALIDGHTPSRAWQTRFLCRC